MSAMKLIERAVMFFNVQAKPSATVIYEEPDSPTGDLKPVRLGAKLDALASALGSSGGSSTGTSTLADITGKPCQASLQWNAYAFQLEGTPYAAQIPVQEGFTVEAIELFNRGTEDAFVKLVSNEMVGFAPFYPSTSGGGNLQGYQVVPARGFLTLDLRGGSEQYIHAVFSLAENAGALAARIWLKSTE